MENRKNSNRDVESFFNNNTQNVEDDSILQHFADFYLDEIGDSIVNEAYDQFEASSSGDYDEDVLLNQAYEQFQNNNRGQHVQRICNEHDYTRQNVSEITVFIFVICDK